MVARNETQNAKRPQTGRGGGLTPVSVFTTRLLARATKHLADNATKNDQQHSHDAAPDRPHDGTDLHGGRGD